MGEVSAAVGAVLAAVRLLEHTEALRVLTEVIEQLRRERRLVRAAARRYRRERGMCDGEGSV